MKAISVTLFRDHMQRIMQKETEALRCSHVLCTADRNFILQTFFFQSLGSDPLASHEVSKLPFNRVKNRFANIFPCKYLVFCMMFS